VSGQLVSHNSVSIFGLFDPSTDVPAAPSNLVAQTLAPTGRRVQLTWTNNASNATGIRVFRATDGGSFSLLTTLPRTATTYTDPATPTLVRGTVYHYRVVATNQQGDGGPSNTADVSTPGSPVLTTTNVCSTEIDLSWTRTGNDHYDLERSRDGVNFTVINQTPIPVTVTTYNDTGLTPGNYSYRVRSINVMPDEDDLSNVVSAQLPTDLIDHSGGFSQVNDLTANGSAVFADGFARLTVGAVNEAGTVFSNAQLSISNFTTTFTFRVHEGSDPRGEGFTFIIQANGPTALGAGAGGLGYAGIGRSVAIKFDIFKPSGNHSSTGLYVNGDPPNDGPDIQPNDVYVDLDGTGIDFNNQRTKQVDLSYDGTTLTETITDTVTGDTFTTAYTVDIPALVGSSSAYIGFGGGTSDATAGGGTCLQDIQTWRYAAPTTLPAAPSNLTAAVAGAQVLLAWMCNSTNEDGYIVEQSTDGVNFALLATTGRGVTTYADTPAQAGTYYYRVKAFNVAGASDYTNIVQMDAPGAPPRPPMPGGPGKAPQILTVDNPGLIDSPSSGIRNDATLGYNSPVIPSTISEPGKFSPVTQVISTSSAMSISVNGSRMYGSAFGDWGFARLREFSPRASLNALDELFALDMLELS
jgi:hypothetical protein